MKSLSLAAGWGGTARMNLGTGTQPLFRSVGAIDVWELARRYHSLNWPDTPVFDFNLQTVSVEQIKEACGEVDLIINTCPCTNLSNANAQSALKIYSDLNAMLLRTVRMLPYLTGNGMGSGGAMLIENVPGLLTKKVFHELLRRECNALKDYVWIETDGKKIKPLNSIHYNTPQTRSRYINIIIHRDRLGDKRLTLPAATTVDYDALRIKNIAPEIQWISTNFTDEFGRHDKGTPRSRENFCFTATATVNLFDQDDRPLSIRRLLDFSGYPQTWIYDEDPKQHTAMWKLAGNSVMAPFAAALGEHMYKLLL